MRSLTVSSCNDRQGKGFPDQSTAHFVLALSERFPRSVQGIIDVCSLPGTLLTCLFRSLSTPILALVDGDPDGLEILSTYKFGSKAAAKLNQESLGVDRIEWLGVKGTEWSRLARLEAAPSRGSQSRR